MGIPMGMAFCVSNTCQPDVIHKQLQFKDWRMAKTFTAALISGGIIIIYMNSSGNASLEHRPLHWILTPIGGALLGIGMALSGSCPGTIWAQMGARVENSSIRLAGGLVGSLLFGIVNQFLPSGGVKTSIPQMLNMSFAPCAWGFVGTLAAGLIASELLSPNPTDWQSIGAGLTIGSLQLPALYFIGSGLGTSSAYLSLMAYVLNTFGIRNATLASFSSSSKYIWQIGLDLGIGLGSMLVSQYVKPTKKTQQKDASQVKKSVIVRNFVGGMLLLFGARLAQGCTSGHGLTGLTHLSLTSFVTMGCMFASGALLERFL